MDVWICRSSGAQMVPSGTHWSTKEVFAGNQGMFDWIGRWQREDVPEMNAVGWCCWKDDAVKFMQIMCAEWPRSPKCSDRKVLRYSPGWKAFAFKQTRLMLTYCIFLWQNNNTTFSIWMGKWVIFHIQAPIWGSINHSTHVNLKDLEPLEGFDDGIQCRCLQSMYCFLCSPFKKQIAPCMVCVSRCFRTCLSCKLTWQWKFNLFQ